MISILKYFPFSAIQMYFFRKTKVNNFKSFCYLYIYDIPYNYNSI